MQGCICPHPPLLIPEVGGASLRRVSATVAALRRLAAEVGEPETVVVMSPHSDGFGDAHVESFSAVAFNNGSGATPPVDNYTAMQAPFTRYFFPDFGSFATPP